MSCFVPAPVWHVPMGQGEGASISDKWNIMAHSALHPIAFWWEAFWIIRDPSEIIFLPWPFFKKKEEKIVFFIDIYKS